MWVKVDSQHFVLFEHESTGQIHGRRRLPYPTFVVRNGNDTCRARGKISVIFEAFLAAMSHVLVG